MTWMQRIEILTPRERECMALLASGMTQKQVAVRLFRSAKTVDNHCTHIYKKLGIRSVVALTRVAVATGMVTIQYEVPA